MAMGFQERVIEMKKQGLVHADQIVWSVVPESYCRMGCSAA